MSQLARLRLIALLVILVVGGMVAWQWYRATNAPVSTAGAETFSASRLAADKAYNAEDWEIAAARFGEVATADPWNGYAWFYRGDSLMHLIAASRPVTSAEPVAAEAEIDPARIQRDEWIAEAFKAFEQSRKTWYLDQYSRYHLARLYSETGKTEESIGLLGGIFDELQAEGRRGRPFNVREHFRSVASQPGFREFFEAREITFE